jgi:hypothetical protein
MKDACAVYLQVCDQRRRLAEQVNQKVFAAADGSLALAKATRTEAWALQELERTTRIYKDLVSNGKTPPQDEDEQTLLM